MMVYCEVVYHILVPKLKNKLKSGNNINSSFRLSAASFPEIGDAIFKFSL